MGNAPTWSKKDLKPRERKAELQRFSPADAAFVFHLAECERCRRQAGRLLAGEEARRAEALRCSPSSATSSST